MTEDLYSSIARELSEAPRGAKGRLVRERAASLGLSAKTLYRRLARLSGGPRRKTRSDAGGTSCDEATLRLIAAMMLGSVRGNGKQTMSIPTARQILLAQGVEVPVSDSRIAVLLQQRGIGVAAMKAPAPCVRMRSLHPNHVHEVDPSLCLLYYSPDGEQHIIHDAECYKNKPFMAGKERMKVWRYVLVDHYSGCICHRYYETQGENALTLWEFLQYAWGAKEDGQNVFHGLPEMLIWDKGSANTSAAIANACRSLRIKTIPHAVGNPRAKGSVENANNLIETLFESRLRLQPVSSVEELNAFAEVFDRLVNADALAGMDTRITRYGRKLVRADLWLGIRQEDLRELPDDAGSLLVSGMVQRTVGSDLTIRYVHPRIKSTAAYSLSGFEGIYPGKVVNVQPVLVNPDGKVVVTYRHGNKDYEDEVLPIEVDAAGFALAAPVFGAGFKRHADTVRDKARKGLETLIGEGERPFADIGGIKALDALRQDGGASLLMEREGRQMAVPRPARRRSLAEACRMVRDGLGWFSLDVRERLKERYPDGPTDAEIESEIEKLLSQSEARHA